MNNKSEKLIDFQAPENSLVLTPLMGHKEAERAFHEWMENIYENRIWSHDSTITWKADWSFEIASPQPLTRDISKMKMIDLKRDSSANETLE